jgi:hypothetical protein
LRRPTLMLCLDWLLFLVASTSICSTFLSGRLCVLDLFVKLPCEQGWQVAFFCVLRGVGAPVLSARTVELVNTWNCLVFSVRLGLCPMTLKNECVAKWEKNLPCLNACSACRQRYAVHVAVSPACRSSRRVTDPPDAVRRRDWKIADRYVRLDVKKLIDLLKIFRMTHPFRTSRWQIDVDKAAIELAKGSRRRPLPSPNSPYNDPGSPPRGRRSPIEKGPLVPSEPIGTRGGWSRQPQKNIWSHKSHQFFMWNIHVCGDSKSWPPILHVALLTVYNRIKLQVDLQADKSPVVVKGPFFPRVVKPRYRIRGTNVWCKSWSIKAKKLRSSRGETYASNLK